MQSRKLKFVNNGDDDDGDGDSEDFEYSG
jgi:hypothetical protein